MNAEIKTPAYENKVFVYFDIETIPCQNPAYLAKLEADVTAPGTFKKQESIDAWLEENRATAALDALSKTSFDGGRGHICTIAWAKNDSPITCEHAETVADEKRIIRAFFDDLDPYHSEALVGHNISGFDIGFLRKRAIILGIALPKPQAFPRDPKPWDKSFFDTMGMWAGGTNRVSMNELCEVLGIQGKDGFDGSMVAGAWANGEHEKIAEYCRDDVERTRAIHKRFLAVGF